MNRMQYSGEKLPKVLNITWGNFNDMPTPHHRISRNEFDEILHCNPYGVEWMDYKQTFIMDRNWPLMSTKIYFLGGNGICVAVRHLYCSKKQAQEIDGDWLSADDKYGHVMQYFRIGCEHQHTEDRGRYMFDHLIHCLDCGWDWGYDSSG